VTDDGVLARDDDLGLRALREDDLPLLARWRNEPHVRAWWEMDGDPVPFTLEDARREHEEDLAGDPSTIGAIIVLTDRPVGYVQWYPWADYAEAAREMGVAFDEDTFGLDIFIGEPDAVGVGVGSRAVDLVCRTLFEERGATSVALLTALGNEHAQHAYERAGFRKVRTALDTDVRDGARVESWLMVRERDAPDTRGA
jgi:aminoglycoside 6'-N-acetyltransferase